MPPEHDFTIPLIITRIQHQINKLDAVLLQLKSKSHVCLDLNSSKKIFALDIEVDKSDLMFFLNVQQKKLKNRLKELSANP
jgi:hypothetical protein